MSSAAVREVTVFAPATVANLGPGFDMQTRQPRPAWVIWEQLDQLFEVISVDVGFSLRCSACATESTETGSYELSKGQVPPDLVPYLPDGFSFKRGRYQLDWENWPLPSGLPSSPGTRAILGVSVVTEDRALGLALEDFITPSAAHFALAGSYTFVLATQ